MHMSMHLQVLENWPWQYRYHMLRQPLALSLWDAFDKSRRCSIARRPVLRASPIACLPRPMLTEATKSLSELNYHLKAGIADECLP